MSVGRMRRLEQVKDRKPFRRNCEGSKLEIWASPSCCSGQSHRLLLLLQDPAQAPLLAGSVALLSGLLLFLLLPPLLFSHMEGWSYMESFYFAFITLSTVGFGDYVIGEWPKAGGLGNVPQVTVSCG